MTKTSPVDAEWADLCAARAARELERRERPTVPCQVLLVTPDEIWAEALRRVTGGLR